jgi:hypothetical protein
VTSETFHEDHAIEENNKIISAVDAEQSRQLPADAYTSHTPERTPCRPRNMGTEVSRTDDACPTATWEKVMTSNTTKKGSHLRKSIQSSIGRLIHGSERR